MSETTPNDDYKTLVDAVVNGYADYVEAIKKTMGTWDWEPVARVCDANAQAWMNLASLYRGEDAKDERTADGDDQSS